MEKSFIILLAGIVIGILIAPEKGIDTRKKIADRLDDYRDDAEDLIKESSGKIKSKFQSLKEDVRDSTNQKF